MFESAIILRSFNISRVYLECTSHNHSIVPPNQHRNQSAVRSKLSGVIIKISPLPARPKQQFSLRHIYYNTHHKEIHPKYRVHFFKDFCISLGRFSEPRTTTSPMTYLPPNQRPQRFDTTSHSSESHGTCTSTPTVLSQPAPSSKPTKHTNQSSGVVIKISPPPPRQKQKLSLRHIFWSTYPECTYHNHSTVPNPVATLYQAGRFSNFLSIW